MGDTNKKMRRCNIIMSRALEKLSAGCCGSREDGTSCSLKEQSRFLEITVFQSWGLNDKLELEAYGMGDVVKFSKHR